jgi:hypothetical protein
MGGWGGCIDPQFLDLNTSSSRPGRFTPGERAPGIHWIGGWGDPKTNLDDRNSWPHLDLNSDPLVIQPIASHCTDYAIPAPSVLYVKYHVHILKFGYFLKCQIYTQKFVSGVKIFIFRHISLHTVCTLTCSTTHKVWLPYTQ